MYVCGWVSLCGWVFLRMCGVSTPARSAKFVIRSGLQKLADKHRVIPAAFGAAADGLQAVVTELIACNPVQVSRHWAILIEQEALRVLFADVFAFSCVTDRLDLHTTNNSEKQPFSDPTRERKRCASDQASIHQNGSASFCFTHSMCVSHGCHVLRSDGFLQHGRSGIPAARRRAIPHVRA